MTDEKATGTTPPSRRTRRSARSVLVDACRDRGARWPDGWAANLARERIAGRSWTEIAALHTDLPKHYLARSTLIQHCAEDYVRLVGVLDEWMKDV